MKKIFLIILVLLLATVGLYACKKPVDKDIPNTYIMNLELEENLEGSLKLIMTNTYKENLSELRFHLYPNSYSEGSPNKAYRDELLKYGEINITKVSIGKDAVDFSVSQDKNFLIVPIKPLPLNETLEVVIDFIVIIPQCNLRLGEYNNTINLGNFYPILAVFENDKWRDDVFHKVGDPFYSETANYIVTVKVPQKTELAATGDIISNKLQEGKRVYEIRADKVRDFAMAASQEFKIMTKMANKITVYYYYINDDKPSDTLEAAVSALKTFSDAFGNYPYNSYRVVETAFAYGGMEYPMMSWVSSSQQDKESVVIHETAHQWWYGLVGTDSINESFIDEGLATFCTLYYYQLRGEEKKFKDGFKDIDLNYKNYIKLKELNSPDFVLRMDKPIYEYSSTDYNTIIYDKSALMFKTVYDVVGKKKFEKSLKYFYEDNCLGIAKREDLYKAFNRACKTDVGKIFDSWIEGSVQMFAA
ncbi:MAG: M1 family metallopeptidase [Bacillota bacterium]|jgi:hypothetical protein|nr:M1 family metallopeptidase [Bacillota bacterium]HHU43264.1 M1 family metallopeptidase [Clostridiales bacterium]